MSGLSTHVLDMTHGCPATDVRVRLWHGDRLLFDGTTNADGRCPDVIERDALKVGAYRLDFEIAAYFRGRGVALSDPPFLDTVSIAFGISDPGAHHHVPLLVSPFGYSTYKGS